MSNEPPQPPKPPKPPRPPKPPIVVPARPSPKTTPVPLKKETVRVTVRADQTAIVDAKAEADTQKITIKPDAADTPAAETRRIVVPKPSAETQVIEVDSGQTVQLQHTQPLQESEAPATAQADLQSESKADVVDPSAAYAEEFSPASLLPWAALSALLSLGLLILTFMSGDRRFGGSKNPYEVFDKDTGQYQSKFEAVLPAIPE